MKESISEVKYVELLEEELWNDGELSKAQVMSRISYHLFMSGKWKLFKVLDKEWKLESYKSLEVK